MQSKTLILPALALFLSVFLISPQIASADPIDIRQNSFGPTPGASYGDWLYGIQSTGYLGTHNTSFDPTSIGGPVFGPDDGISFVGPLVPGSSSNTLNYTINFTSLTALAIPAANPILDFYMWGDWNNDGDWSDPGELFVDLDFDPLALGVVGSTLANSLNFSIPAFAGGNTFINAVVSYDNNTAAIPLGAGGFTGFTYGEQEAYQVHVVPEPASLLLFATGLGAIGLLAIRRRKSG